MGTLGDDCTIEPIMLQFSPWTSLHQVWGGKRVVGAPQVCVPLRGHSEGGFVPTCPCCPFPRPITSFSC